MDSNEQVIVSESNNQLERTHEGQVGKLLKSAENTMQFSGAMQRANQAILQLATPESAIFKRPGAGGNEWSYVIDDYMKRILNQICPLWSSIVLKREFREVTYNNVYSAWYEADCRIHLKWYIGGTLIERVFDDVGIGELVFVNGTNKAIPDSGAKGAVTDGFKRACARWGIATDVYGKSLKGDYHYIVFDYLINTYFNRSSPTTQTLITAFNDYVYANQAEQAIKKMTNEYIPKGVAPEKQTDKFKGKSFAELLPMVLNIMDNNTEQI